MSVLRALCVIAAIHLVTGCRPSGSAFDQHTGNLVHFSDEFTAYSSLLTSLTVRAAKSTRNGYNINYEFLSTGVGWLFFRESWSFGKQLELVVKNETLIGCGHGGCSMLESGIIKMNEEEFNRSASSGFSFKLVGKTGEIEGTVPKEAFQQVMKIVKSRAASQ